MTNLLIVAAITLTLAACAKSDNKKSSDSPNNPPNKPVAQDLSGKSLEDILKIKYDKAILTCNLWSQYSIKFNPSSTPNDVFSWDLKKDSSIPREFTLKSGVQDQKLKFDVRINSISIENTNLLDDDGTRYKIANSPVVGLDYSSDEFTTYGAGQFTRESGQEHRDIKERVKDMTLNSSHAPTGDQMRYFNYVECTVDTEVKAEYQDQFQVEKPH